MDLFYRLTGKRKKSTKVITRSNRDSANSLYSELNELKHTPVKFDSPVYVTMFNQNVDDLIQKLESKSVGTHELKELDENLHAMIMRYQIAAENGDYDTCSIAYQLISDIIVKYRRDVPELSKAQKKELIKKGVKKSNDYASFMEYANLENKIRLREAQIRENQQAAASDFNIALAEFKKYFQDHPGVQVELDTYTNPNTLSKEAIEGSRLQATLVDDKKRVEGFNAQILVTQNAAIEFKNTKDTLYANIQLDDDTLTDQEKAFIERMNKDVEELMYKTVDDTKALEASMDDYVMALTTLVTDPDVDMYINAANENAKGILRDEKLAQEREAEGRRLQQENEKIQNSNLTNKRKQKITL